MSQRDWASVNVRAPNDFIDIKDAELRRQGVVIADFREKSQELYSETLLAMCEVKLSEQRLAEARAKVFASTLPGTGGDLLEAIERDAFDLLRSERDGEKLLKRLRKQNSYNDVADVSSPNGVPSGSEMESRKASVKAENGQAQLLNTSEQVPRVGKRSKQ